MNKSYLNANYTFALGGTNFTVEIDDTLSAEYRAKNYPEPHKKNLHYHPMHEIFFVFDEEIRISFESCTEEYKNSVICLPPYTKHFTHRSSDYRILVSITDKGEKDGFSGFLETLMKPKDVSEIPLFTPNIKVLLRELSDVFYNSKNAISGEIVTSALKMIFFRIYSDNASTEKDNEYSHESQYLALSKLINGCTTPGNDVTIKTAANALHLSERQIARIVNKYYGKSLSTIITEEKLNYASYLLTSTNLPISDVALQSNFHSDNYFFQKFKEYFGLTPLQYRKSSER